MGNGFVGRQVARSVIARARDVINDKGIGGLARHALTIALHRAHAMVEGRFARPIGRRSTPAAFAIAATGGHHELDTLSIASPNAAAGVHFVSTPWAVLSWVHEALALPDPQAWTFIDLGAGKGRAVLSAAQRSYRRVIGVEFAAELAANAAANIEAAGYDRGRVTIVKDDAARFELPAGPAVVFLFNPFGPPVLDAVVDRIAAHAEAGGGPLVTVYLNPVHEAVVAAHPAFRKRSLNPASAAKFALLSPYRLALYDVGAANARKT